MAKNTTKKTKPEIQEETTVDVAQTLKKAAPAPAKKTPKKYAPNDLIECRSVTGGELILVGQKSQLQYTWADYNDVTFVEYQDLQALQSRRSNFLVKPRFIIEDEELVEQWSGDFKKMYDDIVEMDVEALFRLPIGQLKAKLKKAPAGVQLAVKNMAGEKIMNGTLDSLAKIKAIDEVLDTQLMLYIK